MFFGCCRGEKIRKQTKQCIFYYINKNIIDIFYILKKRVFYRMEVLNWMVRALLCKVVVNSSCAPS